MATIKGENLRVMFDQGDPEVANPCVAAATSCQLHLALQVEEDTTKDTEDDWIVNEPVGINWDIQVDALIIEDEQSATGVECHDLAIGYAYDLIFARTTDTPGTQNREEAKESGEKYYKGSAILSDLQINAQNQDIATYTARFTGNGELQELTYE